MEIPILILLAILTVIRSKDAFVVDTDASITQVIRNLEASKSLQADDLTVGEAQSVIDKFNLGDMDTINESLGDAWKDLKL